MVSLVKLTTAVCLAASTALAADGFEIYHKNELTVEACEKILGKTATLFAKKDKAGYCNVKNQPALGSMAHCLKDMPNPKAIGVFIEGCSKYHLTEQEFWDAYENATSYLVTNTSAVHGFNKTELFHLPVKVPHKKLMGAYNSILHRFYNYNRAHIYGWILLAYWGLVVLIAGLCRLVKFAFPGFAHSLNGKVSNTYRRYITLPGLFNGKVSEHGYLFKVILYVIPTRLETILIFIWFILCVAFNTANFHHDSPNVVWPKKATEMGRKVADRTGVIAIYMVPQLVLFAGRNNFMEYISGWSYSRFNLIHQWYARILFILIIAHAVGMTLNGKGVGKYEIRNAKMYMKLGYVATGAGALMMAHSLSYFRQKNYEFFVLSHNILAILFIAGTWVHIADSKYQQYMYAATAVWAFDKFVRLCRLAWFGIKTAEVQLFDDENLKVKIPRHRFWKPFPMAHCFIYFFRPNCFWQSHPFTVLDSVVDDQVITFYIKVKGGMSSSLCQFLSTQPERKAKIKCSVEGPYGHKAPLQHYNDVVFLAGGRGIPGLYAGAWDLTKRQGNQRIKLYWMIRHWNSIEWFYEELKKLEGTTVQPIVYVTRPQERLEGTFIQSFGDDISSEEKKYEDEDVAVDQISALKNQFPFVEFREGRPDVEQLIKDDISEAHGSVAFVACGHGAFVDLLRKVIAGNLPEGKRVDFYDQMQTW
uniref:FAD-binding FR-type domain-containing protein n=1 Tax=Candidozyma auris TaxID=498019 RepID=A0A0L0P5E6_CANAR